MRSNRLHTIRDVDCGEPPVSALGGRREPREYSQPDFYFGGANYGLPQPMASHKHTGEGQRMDIRTEHFYRKKTRPSSLVADSKIAHGRTRFQRSSSVKDYLPASKFI